MSKKFRLLAMVFTVALLTLSASPALTQDSAGDRVQVVASFSILADVARNVAGDAADVTSLIPVGADAHTYNPTPGDLASLVEADVVFVNGMLFEEGLMEAIENAGEDINLVVASSCIQVIAIGAHEHGDDEHMDEEHEEGDHADEAHEDEEHMEGEMMVDSALAALCEGHYAEMEALHEDHHDEEGDHEEGEEHSEEGEHAEGEHSEEGEHDHEHGHAEVLGPLYAIECAGHEHGEEEAAAETEGDDHAHEEGSCDSHVWMDPHNAIYWALVIRDTLSEMDPANAETYAANAQVYIETLDALAHDFVREAVDTVPEENRVLVTNHEFLGYFASSYDFEVVGTVIPGGSTTAEPGAASIAQLIDTVREENVPAIFAETSVRADIAEQIANETGAQFYTLFSGTLSDESGPASTYIDYIRHNVSTIVQALGGQIPQ